MSLQNPQFQTAIQALRQRQAQTGLGQSSMGLTQEAGLRGMQGNAASQMAFEQAMGTAGQQAGLIAGQPVQTPPPRINPFMAALGGAATGIGTYAYLHPSGAGGGQIPYNSSGPSWTIPGQQPAPRAPEPWNEPPLFPNKVNTAGQFPGLGGTSGNGAYGGRQY